MRAFICVDVVYFVDAAPHVHRLVEWTVITEIFNRRGSK